MKYHSPLSSIIISVLILLVFVSVSIFTCLYFDIYSPTYQKVEEFLTALEQRDSAVKVGFSSIDRNLSKGIVINNAVVRLEENIIFKADSVNVRQGLFNIIGSLFSKRGEFNLLVENPVIDLSSDDLAYLQSIISSNGGFLESGKSSSEAVQGGKDLPEYLFHLRLNGLELSYDSILSLSEAMLDASFSTSTGLERFSASLPQIGVDTGQLDVQAENLVASLEKTDVGYGTRLSLKKAEGDAKDYTFNFEEIAFETFLPADFKFDPRTLEFRASIKRSDIEKDDGQVALRSYPLGIVSEKGRYALNFSYLFVSYEQYALYMDSIKAELDSSFDVLGLSISKSNIYKETDSILYFDNIAATVDITDRRINLTSALLRSNYIGNLTDSLFSSISIDSLAFNLDSTGTELALDLMGEGSLRSKEAVFDATTFQIIADASVSEGRITSASMDLFDLRSAAVKDSLTLAATYDGNQAYLSLDYGSSPMFDLATDFQSFSLVSNILSLPLEDFQPLISRYYPMLLAYVSPETSFSGYANVQMRLDEQSGFKMTGDMDIGVALEDISFKTLSFNLGSSLNAELKKDEVEVSSFNLTSDYLRIDYAGSLVLPTFLPEGSLTVSLTRTGRKLMGLEVDKNEDNGFVLSLSLPVFGDTELTGDLMSKDGVFSSQAFLRSYSSYYDFDLELDLNNSSLLLLNEKARIEADWLEKFNLLVSFDNFALPVSSSSIRPCLLDGEIHTYFDYENQNYYSYADDFRITNMRHLPYEPSIILDYSFRDGVMDFSNILITSEELLPMEGNVRFDIFGLNLAALFSSSSETLMLSVTEVDDYVSGLLTTENLDLRRFGLDDGLMDMSLIGRGSELDNLSFSGGFRITGSDMVNKPMSIGGELFVNKSELTISELGYESGSLRITSPQIRLSSHQGIFQLPLSLSYVAENKDRDYPVSISTELMIEVPAEDNLYELVGNTIENRGEAARSTISLTSMHIDNKFNIENRASEVVYRDGNLIFTGSLLSGTYNLEDQMLDLEVLLEPLVNINAHGRVLPSLDLDVQIEDFNVSSINLFFPSPIVTFGPDSLANANVTLLGTFGDIHMYGDVWADRVDVDVFWVPDDHLIAHNAHFTIWDNNIRSSLTAVTAVEKDTQRRKEASAKFEFNLLPTFGFDYYQIDCYVPDGNEVSFRLPLIAQNFDIIGNVSGHYMLRQDGIYDIYMSGEANCDNFQLSGGLHEIPDWLEVNDKMNTSFDFDLLLRENVSFVYPLGASPIITAYAAENQHLRLYSSGGDYFGASGSVDLRAGEIYYFQKSFYIREGSILLRENDQNELDPVINLRAQLRDFDSNGEKVDIYLILRDATLDNFNPTFESSPAKDLSEIMGILGQAIISADSMTGSLSSVVSLVSTGFDVLNRVGFISTGDDSLRNSIRTSLNLDTFSLHTNIIENLVFDAVGLTQTSPGNEISPLASYLDGTTLYMGKYLTPSIYLEAMAHLVADRNNGISEQTSFLTNDLSLDTEISIEWENPLCTVNIFTQMQSINAFEFLDTLGFSLSKRFVF